MVRLNDDVIRSLKPARILKESTTAITSLQCSDDGQFLFTVSSPSDTDVALHASSPSSTLSLPSSSSVLRLYNLHKGSIQCEYPLVSAGGQTSMIATASCFTHSSHSVVLATSGAAVGSGNGGGSGSDGIFGTAGTIRHLSLHDNRTLRLHRGHTADVVCLEMHPLDDGFISGSADGTVRLWDLRGNACRGLLHLYSGNMASSVSNKNPTIAIDPTGMVFAVGSNDSGATGTRTANVRLYDVRQHDRGPFATWIVPEDAPAALHGMKFSPDGSELLCTTDAPSVLVLDAYSDAGKTLHEIPLTSVPSQGQAPRTDSSTEASTSQMQLPPPPCATYTPDGQYMLVPDGTAIRVLSRSSRWKQAVISRNNVHAHQLTGLIWNPNMCVMISSCTNVALWLPSS